MASGFNFKRKQNTMKATVEIQYDEYTGDYFIELPPDILKAANLATGDSVIWKKIDNDHWSFSKKDTNANI